MSVIKMYGYEAAQQTEYQTKKWATKEEMQALSSGDEQRDVILAQGATVAFYEGDKHWETSVSNNVFAFGGTGSGKTDTMTQSEGTKKIGAPARDRGSGLRQ